MGWDTVTGLGIILTTIGTLVFAAFRLLSYGEEKGVEKTLLEVEKAGREARDQVDQITQKAEEDYDESIDNVSSLDFDDINRLLFTQDGGETNSTETSSST